MNVPLDLASLSWQGSDPNQDRLSYTLRLWPADAGSASLANLVVTTQDKRYEPPDTGQGLGLQAATSYRWQVQASDGISSSLSPIWQFTTAGKANYQLYLPLINKQGPLNGTLGF